MPTLQVHDRLELDGPAFQSALATAGLTVSAPAADRIRQFCATEPGGATVQIRAVVQACMKFAETKAATVRTRSRFQRAFTGGSAPRGAGGAGFAAVVASVERFDTEPYSDFSAK